jgi:hypothetical protein
VHGKQTVTSRVENSFQVLSYQLKFVYGQMIGLISERRKKIKFEPKTMKSIKNESFKNSEQKSVSQF